MFDRIEYRVDPGSPEYCLWNQADHQATDSTAGSDGVGYAQAQVDAYESKSFSIRPVDRGSVLQSAFSPSTISGAKGNPRLGPPLGSIPPSCTLEVPLVRRVPKHARAARAFVQWVQDATRNMRKPGQVAVAPFGGSRITSLAELDLDGLVLIDWSSPGSRQEVLETFDQRKEELTSVLNAALNIGGMNTDDVLKIPLTAQVLARLQAELGVKQVEVRTYVLNSVSLPSSSVTGPGIEPGVSSPEPGVTRFRFRWRGRDREVLILTHAFFGDRPEGSSWPGVSLQSLCPRGYHWAVLSADGVGFFSRSPENGLQAASRDLVRGLVPGGGVLTDVPTNKGYLEGTQSFGGMDFMLGRADLGDYGLEAVAALEVPQGDRVFGYSGAGPEDRVVVFRKPASDISADVAHSPSSTPIFDFSSATAVGSPYVVRLEAQGGSGLSLDSEAGVSVFSGRERVGD